MKGKRYTFRFHSPEVMRLLEELPKGNRSLLVEAGILLFQRSAEGRAIIDTLKSRKTPEKVKNSRKPRTKKEKLKEILGDFD